MDEVRFYSILDLIEEIDKVDQMIELHRDSPSSVMINQYKHQKLKLSNCLVQELLLNNESRSEVMYIIKLFIEKFYQDEIQNHQFKADDYLKKIEDVFI